MSKKEKTEMLRAKLAEAKARKAALMSAKAAEADEAKRLEHDLERRNQEVKELKKLRVRLQQSAETEEEFITNNLMKKLTNLRKEKEELAQQAEKEEEFITNTLQRRLKALKQEKIDIENRLEQEQEHIVNKLQQQLLRMSEETNKLQMTLHQSRAALLKRLGEQLSEATNSIPTEESDGKAVVALAAEINRLQEENTACERRMQAYDNERLQLSNLLEKLRKENIVREQEHQALVAVLERVSEERRELFIAAEQLLEKRTNEALRSRSKRSRLRSSSEMSTDVDSLSSSMFSSTVSTPKYPPAPLSVSSLTEPSLRYHPLVGSKRSSSVPVGGVGGCSGTLRAHTEHILAGSPANSPLPSPRSLARRLPASPALSRSQSSASSTPHYRPPQTKSVSPQATPPSNPTVPPDHT